jgi:hypothetical protein
MRKFKPTVLGNKLIATNHCKVGSQTLIGSIPGYEMKVPQDDRSMPIKVYNGVDRAPIGYIEHSEFINARIAQVVTIS